MRYKVNLTILLATTILLFNCAKKTETPKREFRAVWFTTVKNLDWPATPNETVEDQKANAVEMLDKLHKANFNAIIFQVRDECDAFYKSSYDPWSYYLTGEQGTAPAPFYDPLEFMTTESHKRAMELHAWINPFRAVKSVGDYKISETHISETNPDWVYTSGKTKYLNAGIPEVRNYITNTIVEIIKNYDIDGIHFDDYFYPYTKITNQDSLTFLKYSRGIDSIDDWRRDNINSLISQVNDSIQAIKPDLKFGISPFGIWKPEHPKGIKGMSAYDIIYCDPKNWLDNKTVDYITPQLYWPIGGDQDYQKLNKWWLKQLNGRHFYPGHAPYRLPKWNDDEICNQIEINRKNKRCDGSVFFRTNVGILDNPKGLYDSLLTKYYKYPALIPTMKWKSKKNKSVIENLEIEIDTLENKKYLTWEIDSSGSNNNFVIYRFNKKNRVKKQMKNGKNIINVTINNRMCLETVNEDAPIYYAISSLNRTDIEGKISKLIKIDEPQRPTLLEPENEKIDTNKTIVFMWNSSDFADKYKLEISFSDDFNGEIFKTNCISDTSIIISDFENKHYYWRVKSYGIGGGSKYSQVFEIR